MLKISLIFLLLLTSRLSVANTIAEKHELHGFGIFNLTNKAELDTVDVDSTTVSLNTNLKSPGIGAGAEFIYHIKEISNANKAFNIFISSGLSFDNKREVDSCTFVVSGTSVTCDPAGSKIEVISLHIHALFEINPYVRIFAGPAYNQPNFSTKSEYIYSLDGSVGYNAGLSLSFDNFRLQGIYKNLEGDAKIVGSDINASGKYNYSSFLISFGIYFNSLVK